ncbi:hypothetical protein M8J75_006170 [Diaphorina citri]|nr:hypothetical protein M8J75_006170 [Diaphorina citri]
MSLWFPLWKPHATPLASAKKENDMCRQLQNGVQALFGPSDALLGPHVQSICEALDVPHMESRLDLELNSKEFSVNLYPSQKLLNAAFKDVIRFLNWTKVAIVYEEDNGLFKLQELVKTPPTLKTEMYIRHANPSTYRNVLREIRQKEIFNLIIDTSTTHISQFFRATQSHLIFSPKDVNGNLQRALKAIDADAALSAPCSNYTKS